MIIDYLAQFCDEDEITATVANAIVGDVMDLGATPTLQDVGNGTQPIYLVITIDTAVTSNGSATVAFTLLTDSTADLATSATTMINTGDIAIASLTAGTTLVYPLPPTKTYERYMGIFAQTKTQTLNTGTCSAFLTLNPPRAHIYPDAL